MKNTNTQRLADMFSDVGGRQVLVGIYDDEAVLYAQVSERTALKIANPLCMMQCLAQKEDAARSADGLTYCWTFSRSRLTPGHGNWRDVAMFYISGVLRSNVPELLGPDGEVDYVDNRGRDANTIAAFASVLETK